MTATALVDVMFSEHRDMASAKAFFSSANAVTGVTPAPPDNAHLNNRLEQDHRGIKGRYHPMRGFACPRSAERFCRGYEELRNFLRSRWQPYQYISADFTFFAQRPQARIVPPSNFRHRVGARTIRHLARMLLKWTTLPERNIRNAPFRLCEPTMVAEAAPRTA